MDITWLGTASILIKSKDTVLLFDPFFGSFREDGVSFPLEILPQVQAVSITHPHLDHFCNIGTILKAPGTPFRKKVSRGSHLFNRICGHLCPAGLCHLCGHCVGRPGDRHACHPDRAGSGKADRADR